MNAPAITPVSAFGPDGVQWAFDSSTLKAASKCLAYYDLKYLRQWERAGGSIHLWFGGLYASALERFYKLTATGLDREAAIADCVRFLLIESWDHDRDEQGNRLPGTGKPRTFPIANSAKNRDTLLRTFIWYFEDFKDDPYTTHIRSDGSPAVEASFRLPVDDGLVLCGHIDRLANDRESNIFVHDQKTTGQTISPSYFKQFKPDIQFALYTFAGKAIYNIPVKGVIVDAVQIAVGFSRYARSPVLFTDAELNEWYEETMKLMQTVQSATRENFFPHNRMACHEFGGCEFREICSRTPSVRDNFLKGEFVQREERWDPLKAR